MVEDVDSGRMELKVNFLGELDPLVNRKVGDVADCILAEVAGRSTERRTEDVLRSLAIYDESDLAGSHYRFRWGRCSGRCLIDGVQAEQRLGIGSVGGASVKEQTSIAGKNP